MNVVWSLRAQYVGVAVFAAMSVLLPIGAALSVASEERGPLLVIAAPWADFDNMIRSAGGWPVGPQSASFANFATTQGSHHVFKQDLLDAGAWAIIRSSSLARLCGVDI